MAIHGHEPGRHGFRHAKKRRCTRHRPGFWCAADAARIAWRQHLFKLPGGQARSMAAYLAAAGPETLRRARRRALCVVPRCDDCCRYRSGYGPVGRPRATVEAGERCRLFEPRGETPVAGLPGRRGDIAMTREDALANLMLQASDEGA